MTGIQRKRIKTLIKLLDLTFSLDFELKHLDEPIFSGLDTEKTFLFRQTYYNLKQFYF